MLSYLPMLWIFYLAISIIFFTIFSILTRIGLEQTTYPRAYTVISEYLCGIIALIFLPLFGLGNISQVRTQTIILLFVAIIAYAISNFFRFDSFKYEEASVLSAIFPLNNIFAILISIFFFNKSFYTNTGIGLAIILLSSILIGFSHKKLQLSKGIVYAIISAVFLGFAVGLAGSMLTYFSPPFFLALLYFIQAIISHAIILRTPLYELKHEFMVTGDLLLLSSALLTMSFLLYLVCFTIGNITQVIAVNSFSTITVTICAIIFLHERTRVDTKIICSLIAILGMLVIMF